MPGTCATCAPQLDVDLSAAASRAAVEFPIMLTITAQIGHDGIAPSGVRQTDRVDGKVYGGKADYKPSSARLCGAASRPGFCSR